MAGAQLCAAGPLGPVPSARTRLVERVEELTETRAGALDAHAAELRRIERDLHDGTQARLVTVAMRLGLAEKGLTKDPDKAVRLLREALRAPRRPWPSSVRSCAASTCRS